jgi:hypothetical protein
MFDVMKYHNMRYRDFVDGKMTTLLTRLQKNGYTISRKYNGWQIIGDRKGVFSKSGKVKIRIPSYMIRKLPETAFAAELVVVGGGSSSNPHMVARLVNTSPSNDLYLKLWSQARLMVFDTVENKIRDRPFHARCDVIKTMVKSVGEPWFKAVQQHCFPRSDMTHSITTQFFNDDTIEGVVFTHPDEPYESGKSRIRNSSKTQVKGSLYRRYKLKVRSDASAIILGHTSKRTLFVRSLEHMNKYTGKGCEFIVGVGLSQKQKEDLDAASLHIGAFITYSYCGQYESGVPSHAYFRHVRDPATM